MTTEVGAAHEHTQVWVENAGLPDDFCGLGKVCAQDQAAGCGDARFLECSCPQDVAIDRRQPLRTDVPNGIKVQINHRNLGSTLLK